MTLSLNDMFVYNYILVQVKELSQLREYQRYKRLQHLLQKSSIYSKFLLQRMETQMEEKKVRPLMVMYSTCTCT